ncbi:hypothetical protein GCM10009759_23720 [Kitasatospora saccharophila]|uniref:Uncharacterized protein n=1 Tax=Kitasatospora saccharophila TaxID=407973 RepID=A0ABN2WMA8_9ACTN
MVAVAVVAVVVGGVHLLGGRSAEQLGPGRGAAALPGRVAVVDPGVHRVHREADVLGQVVQERLRDGVVALADPDGAGRLYRGQPPPVRGLVDRGDASGGGVGGVPELQVAAVLLAVVQGAPAGHDRLVQAHALDRLRGLRRRGRLLSLGDLRRRRGRLVLSHGVRQGLGQDGAVHPAVAEHRGVPGGAAERLGDGGQRGRPAARQHAQAVAGAAVGDQQVADARGVQRLGDGGQVGLPGLRVEQVVADLGQPAAVAHQPGAGGGQFVLAQPLRVDRGGRRRGRGRRRGYRGEQSVPAHGAADHPSDRRGNCLFGCHRHS